jgi:hypothetical protein
MNHFNLFTLLCIIGLFLNSCRSSRLETVRTESREYEVHAQHGSFLTRPLVADLEVGKKRVQTEYVGSLKLSMEDMKKNATAQFLKYYRCDYIADPVFEISKKIKNNLTREIKITLTGFPVTYTKIYQVDSLPASIRQYSDINKDIRRIRYLNSIEKEQIVWGVEVLGGEYLGAQIDFPLNLNTRYYISFQKMNKTWNFSANIFENRSSDFYIGTGFGQDYFTFSTGVFKESSVADFLKVRYGGGLNLTSYSLTSDFVGFNQIRFGNIYNLGLRLKGGLDIPVYRNFSLVGQAHLNIDGLNVVVTDDPGIEPNASLSVEKIDIKKSPEPPLFLGLGLRVVF